MLRKLKLFKRFPRLFWRKGERYHLVDPGIRGDYPALAEDFALLDEYLMGYFWELDEEALKAQNQFRRGQIIVIIGAALATILGALQATYPTWKLPSIFETALTTGLGILIVVARSQKIHEGYFTNRLKAERLRGEYFLFLGRAEPYSKDEARLSNLVRRVAEIRKEEISYEPAK